MVRQARHVVAGSGLAWPGQARLGKVGQARLGEFLSGMVVRGVAGEVWFGMAWHVRVRRG